MERWLMLASATVAACPLFFFCVLMHLCFNVFSLYLWPICANAVLLKVNATGKVIILFAPPFLPTTKQVISVQHTNTKRTFNAEVSIV